MDNFTIWHWINVFFIFFSGAVAIWCFRGGDNKLGWANLLASSLNLSIVITQLTK